MDHGGGSNFASTHWSLVLAAGGQATPSRAAAMAALCERYWSPLYSYVRKGGYSVEDAQDVTQSFFARMLEKDILDRAAPGRGRFRTFLLASLKNFTINEWERALARKRGGHVDFLSLDAMMSAESGYTAEVAAAGLTPEQLYERKWALTLLERCTDRLAGEFAKVGKAGLFRDLKLFLTGDGAGLNYSQVAASLGMSDVAVRVAVHRLRGRFRDVLLEEIAQTVSDPSDSKAIDEELRYLLDVL